MYDIPDTPAGNPAPGDLCPRGLDRSLFTADQLVYLDEFFSEYDRAAFNAANRLLSLPVPGVHSLFRTRTINLAVLDYVGQTYTGADTLSGRELARLCKLSGTAWSQQVERIRAALLVMSKRH